MSIEQEEDEFEKVQRIFTMKNYFFSLAKINNETTRQFQIILNEIEDFLSINQIVNKYKKTNVYSNEKNLYQEKMKCFVQIFDFFSEKNYFFLDIYEKPNQKTKKNFLLFFCVLMFFVFGLLLFEIFYLKPYHYSIVNTAIGGSTFSLFCPFYDNYA